MVGLIGPQVRFDESMAVRHLFDSQGSWIAFRKGKYPGFAGNDLLPLGAEDVNLREFQGA